MSQEIIDAIEDASESIADLTKVVAQLEPKVTVQTPAPHVEVHPPIVNVTYAKGWVFTITKRDPQGRIETLTATPAT